MVTVRKRTKNLGHNLGGHHRNPPEHCKWRVYVHGCWWIDAVLCKYHCSDLSCPMLAQAREQSDKEKKRLKRLEERKRLEKLYIKEGRIVRHRTRNPAKERETELKKKEREKSAKPRRIRTR